MGVILRGSRWYVKYKDAAGRWRRKATTARTKAEAQRFWHSLAEQAQRQREGLAPRPVDAGMTLWMLCEWWIENKCPAQSRRRAENQLRVHIQRTPRGALPLLAVTSEVMDGFFETMARAEYSGRTINQLRAWLRSVFNRARRAKMWIGDNPVSGTQRREVHAGPRPTLEAAQVPVLLRHVRPPWQCFFALGVYMGLRKGEICGLRKSDYNPARRTLFIGRSYLWEFTKTKRSDTLPVPSVLVPYLEEALKTKGPWLCPREDGQQRNEECAPEDNLRSAFRRAGLTTGEWLHKCRRCKRMGRKTPPVVTKSDAKMKCVVPGCNFTLWPTAVPLGLRFHDLRHTTATLLLRAGTPIQHVQRIMRHAQITTTVNTYGHLLTEDLRPFLEQLGAGPPPVQGVTLRLATDPK